MRFSAAACARARACEDMLPIIQSTHTHTFHQEEGPCASQLRPALVPERVGICYPHSVEPRSYSALFQCSGAPVNAQRDGGSCIR